MLPSTSVSNSRDDITPIIQANRQNNSASGASAAFGSDFDSFLLLLTTQLRNQDPTQPLDTNQFTQQIAMLSNVEQTININSNLEKLIGLANSSQLNSVAGYIGKRAEADGTQGVLNQGRAVFVYDLAKAAAQTEITISDPLGRVVFSGDGSTYAGRNEVIWDGVNQFTGEELPDGPYRFMVKAKDSGGQEIEATTFTSGRVTAANLEDGKVTLSLGDEITLPLDKILSVRELF